ncbi:hypothetical protein TrLO_g6718 [Triparma laevis f. longispina]|uniref:Uncharacterized protein n=1 Tax=Triparma laevis f. longispina TaxID=1714387 RepID=A0A9W7FNN3_9STRA|nr:hypothetical protein TrLO_g6718 [Triparma laevis f. longispina]
MASEEERAKIMAEYMAGDGADLPPDEEDGDFEGEDEDEEGEGVTAPPAPPAILKGSLSNASQNSKNYLVYSGTWSYGLDSSSSWKFKLSCEIDSEFDFVSVKEEYVMKGYFIMKDESTEAGKSKVPEEGVTLKFDVIPGKEGKRWTVNGEGTNQFGAFKLVGEYRSKGLAEGNKMNFEKKYDEVEEDFEGESSADEDFDDDDKADEDELNALDEEANLSIEELRKRAYGGEGGEEGGDEGGGKKAKTDTE